MIANACQTLCIWSRITLNRVTVPWGKYSGQDSHTCSQGKAEEQLFWCSQKYTLAQFLNPSLCTSLAPLPRSYRASPMQLACMSSQGQRTETKQFFIRLVCPSFGSRWSCSQKYWHNLGRSLAKGSINQNFTRLERNERDCSSKWSNLPDFCQAGVAALSLQNIHRVYMQ